jgi:hypothetical protein
MAACHAENERRRALKASGEVFYGPATFRFEVWFELWLEQLQRAVDRVPEGGTPSLVPLLFAPPPARH